MSHRLDIDPDTLAVVRHADPLQDPRVEADAGLDTESALRLVLARTDERPPATHRAPRRRRRRAVQLGLVATSAAAASLVAVNVGSSGHGEISQALRSSGISIAPAHAAPLLVRVRRALTGASGSILEVQTSVTKTGPGGTARSQTAHSWTQTSAPHDTVIVSGSAGQPTIVSGEQNRELELYDPASNTIDVMTDTPSVEAATGTPARAQALALLRRPGVTINRHATLDGSPAIAMSTTSGPFISTLYVTPGTDQPLEWTQAAAPGAPAADRVGSVVIRYLTYRTLTGTQASSKLVSLTQQHPSASIVHLDRAAWNTAFSKLGTS